MYQNVHLTVGIAILKNALELAVHHVLLVIIAIKKSVLIFESFEHWFTAKEIVASFLKQRETDKEIAQIFLDSLEVSHFLFRIHYQNPS